MLAGLDVLLGSSGYYCCAWRAWPADVSVQHVLRRAVGETVRSRWWNWDEALLLCRGWRGDKCGD